MKGTTIAIGEINGRNAAAQITDGKITDFLIDSDGPDAPGAIYRATCDRQIKGTGGMFLRLPDGKSGYLRKAHGLKPGQTLLVQVTGFAENGKAVPVTPKVIFKSRYAIVTPGVPGVNISRGIRDEEERVHLKEIASEIELPPECGLILRSLCQDADAQEITNDITATCEIARQISEDTSGKPDLLLNAPDAQARAWMEWATPDALDASPNAFLDNNVDDLLEEFRTVAVTYEATTIFIEPTRALIAVDVNTGANSSMAAGLKANIALARDLPRQLRCRGLGGQITLDLAPMPKKDRKSWEHVLAKAFRVDPIETALVGWTPLGNFELQRKRERAPTAPWI